MRRKLLSLIKDDAKLSEKQLAVMLDCDVQTVKEEITECENSGIIRGYQAIIDWDKFSENEICAIIEMKVTPKVDTGFEDIARQVMLFEEVESVYLMASTYDFSIMVRGKDIRQISQFVAQKLSTLPSVVSTSTHFVLKRYKDHHVVMCDDIETERRNIMS